MKKCTSFLLVLALLLTLLPVQAAGPAGTVPARFYSETDKKYGAAVTSDLVKLTLDGQPLTAPDVPALMQVKDGQGRTLVPVRLVAEQLGAQVVWLGESRQVVLLKDGGTIVLTLGSSKATVNGEIVELPNGVPAGMVLCQGKESTMVPLRFVSEQLGAQVDWDSGTFTAVIRSTSAPTPTPSPAPTPTLAPAPSTVPTPSPAPTPSTVPTPSPAPAPSPSHEPVLPAEGDRGAVLWVESDANAQTVFIATDHVPEMNVLDLGNRVVVDIQGAVMSDGIPGIIYVDNEQIQNVRTALHGDDLGYGYPHTARVVVDLKDGITYRKNVKVEQQLGGVMITTFLNDGDRGDGGESYVPTTPIDPHKSTIVLDAGHGGSAAGATYEGIMEKDITLQMTKKLQAILLAHGYNVVMIREDDRYMDLYDRCDIANAVDADLFVSVHANATDKNNTFEGTFTYYYPGSETGKKLAQLVQNAVCAAAGSINRGILNADFVVLRETNMTAVLVETGFMTSHAELMRLCDDAYQSKIAQGIADGVVQYLNSLQ